VKKLLCDLSSGKLTLQEVPIPSASTNHIVVQTTYSLISTGTERMLIDFGESTLVQKARSQPDKVKQVIEKAKSDGLLATVDAVRSKLNSQIPLGYCNAGVVVEVGEGVTDFIVGDRVVSNGSHSEFNVIPKTLASKIPPDVDDVEAVFCVPASVALNSVRLAKPDIGEKFVVIGCGLIGLLTIQILLANGCEVIALDFDEKKLDFAQSFGARILLVQPTFSYQDMLASCPDLYNVDGVIIAASSKSSSLISNAAQMSRKQGRVILSGVSGLDLVRDDFYEKEIKFQVSCSYGAGRYDPAYEAQGVDYPLGYVRWTVRRNFDAILLLMKMQRISCKKLATDKYSFDDVVSAFNSLKRQPSTISVLLYYAESNAQKETVTRPKIKPLSAHKFCHKSKIGVIGAGNYASRVLIPALVGCNAHLYGIASEQGVSASLVGKQYNFQRVYDSAEMMLTDPLVDTIFIATQHNSHALLASEALRNGKHVYVEKPLALTLEEVANIESCYEAQKMQRHFTVGFNRRFSPHSIRVKELIQATTAPVYFLVTVNAGLIDSKHWTRDKNLGGGRIIGEACHFIDLLRFLAGSAISEISSESIEPDHAQNDNARIGIKFQNGFCGDIIYTTNGSRSYPKERIEVFSGGRNLVIDNFKVTKGYGWKGISSFRTWGQKKGHSDCVKGFLNSLESDSGIIPFDEIIEVSRKVIEVSKQLSAGRSEI